MTLNELSFSRSSGREARITALTGPAEMVDRLREMGFCEGQPVQVVQRLPFGGPGIVQIGASLFALRQEEARCAVIELMSAP